jgi:hypothetical protein
MHGWNLYEGVVTRIEHRKVEEGSDTGVIHIRVLRTLWGKPLGEIVRPYGCIRDDATEAERAVFGFDDWGGGPWDFKQPQVGRHLLVLFDSCLKSAGCPDGVGKVHFVWRLREKDSLVDGFRDAADFLRARDPKRRREHFRKLCQSDQKNVRRFALDASFTAIQEPRGDGDRTPVSAAIWSELVADFFHSTDPRRLGEDRPTLITGGFLRFEDPDYASKASPEVRLLFEDWYLGELGRGSDPARQGATVEDLKRIVDGLGPSTTVDLLFANGGRGPLLDRLEACSHSADEKMKEKSEEFLKAFRGP